MEKIVFGQYNATQYPLCHYTINEIPQEIKNVIININRQDLAIFRGGMAYIFITRDVSYVLKDMDMLARHNEKDISRIVGLLQNADVIFINKNTFNDDVITAFWNGKDGYYKLDILLMPTLPISCVNKYDNIQIKSVTASYIWQDRIVKIAEKKNRKHTVEKTLNHYHVATQISKYLLEHRCEVLTENASIVQNNLKPVKNVLDCYISKSELDSFLNLQNILLKEVQK